MTKILATTIKRLSVWAAALALLINFVALKPVVHATPATDDYPGNLKTAAMDSVVDPWSFWNRECTSFVAWRLNNDNHINFQNHASTGSYGNAIGWKNRAIAEGKGVDNTPKVGAVAWFDFGGGNGHVAWVEAVSANASQVTIEDYNSAYNGVYSMRTINASNVTKFLHLGGEDNISSGNNTVLRTIHKAQSDGTNAVYWAKADSVFESWWHPGDGQGVHHSQLVSIPQGDIKDIDVQIMSDNEHLLYTATTHNIYETWWYPNQGIHTSGAIYHTDSGIRRIQKTLDSDGTQQLYVMTDAGVDECWWRPGTGVNCSRLYTLANPVAMKKSIDSNGQQVLYVADQAWAYEVRWGGGLSGINVRSIINISQGDIVDLDLSVDPDNTHRLYVGARNGGGWEASWNPSGGGIGYWQVAGGQGVVGVQKYMDGSTNLLYIATQTGVYEYSWQTGSTSVQPGIIVQGLTDVHDFQRDVSVDGAQVVYTAFGTNISETFWWGAGQPLTTNNIE
jgi:surface antigen